MTSTILPCYRDRGEVEQRFAQERLVTSSQLRSTLQAMTPEDRWVQLELPYYQEQFTVLEDLVVCVTTFNVGCKKPPTDMAPLVVKQLDGKPVDIIVVGLQEVDMSAAAMWKEETEAAAPWVSGLSAELGAEAAAPASSPGASPGATTPSTTNFASLPVAADGTSPYVMIGTKQLVGLLLCTFVRRPLMAYVQDVQIATTATGALGSVGNKGGVAISLRVHMTSLCFITAHLAAGQTQVNKRNEDVHNILCGTDFNGNKRQAVLAQGVFDVAEILPVKLPKDHDVVVVAGDLNYRLDLSYEAALALATSRGAPGGGTCDYDALLREDQLVKEMKSPHSPWRGFTDLRPQFQPTYRYDMGTTTYDTSDKKRVPSYTDRILHWTQRKELHDRIEIATFTSLQQVCSSDHKPVQMVGKIPVRVVVPQRQSAVVDALRQKVAASGLDRVSAATTTVSEAAIDFGIQEFHHCNAQRTVTVSNKGECTACVRVFRQQTEASQGMWLRVTPQTIHVLPGASIELTVEVVLDKQALRWVPVWLPYRGQASVRLKSNLVLHVFGGPVHMIECVTVVQPSVFGNTLDNVIRLEGNTCLDAYVMTTPPDIAKTVTKPRLPKELWYLCDAIYKRGLKFPGLLTESGSKDACAEIMSFLDRNNKPLPEEFAVDAIGSCLLIFLGSLQDTVIPASQYHNALSAIRTGGKVPLFFVQQQLPPLHANVFLYVMSLMNFMLRPSNAQVNELTPTVVAQVMAQVMMPRPPGYEGGGGEQHGGPLMVTSSHHATTPQQLRQAIQQDHNDGIRFMLYFLTPPPANMQ